jgi:hypothetical protein
MATPTKPAKPTPVRNATRLLVLGLSLGVGAFILNVLLSYQVSILLLHVDLSPDSVWRWILAKLLYEQMGVLLVAPVIAYAAGLLIDGRRWVLASAMIVSLQAIGVNMRVISFGSSVVFGVTEVLLLIVFTGIGVALSAWAMGRGQAKARVRVESKPFVPTSNLAAIDFEAVKKEQGKPPAAAEPQAKPAEPAPSPPVSGEPPPKT